MQLCGVVPEMQKAPLKKRSAFCQGVLGSGVQGTSTEKKTHVAKPTNEKGKTLKKRRTRTLGRRKPKLKMSGGFHQLGKKKKKSNTQEDRSGREKNGRRG